MVLGNTQAAVFDKSTWCGFLALLHEFYDFTLHNHLGFCLLISKVVIVNWTLYDYIWKSAPSRQLHCFLFHSLFYSWLNSFFFLNEIGVWTQGFALENQELHCLSHICSPILFWLFWRWGLVNYFPGRPSAMILQISASQVARITDVNHWHLAHGWILNA
jgi:hypothetical protein